MNAQNIASDYESPRYKSVVIIYSNNLKCYEQHSFLGGARTFVLICTKDVGYVAVAARMEQDRYLTLKRWRVGHPGGFSFSIPISDKFHLKCVPVGLLLAHYRDEQDLWMAIEKHTRSHVVLPLPHGNTA